MVCVLKAKLKENNSERLVDALAENGKSLTHLLTTSNQEMLAHPKIKSCKENVPFSVLDFEKGVKIVFFRIDRPLFTDF